MSGTQQFLGYAGMCTFIGAALAGIEHGVRRATYLPVKRTDSSDEQEGADS